MRKDFTAISAFSTMAAFTAGAVLCVQFSQTELQVGLTTSAPVLWAVEAVIFGTAVYVWRSKVSFFGWLLGIGAMLALRIALVSAAALIMMVTQGMDHTEAALQQAADFVPRTCAVVFSLMAFYPLRVFLPLKEGQSTRRGRAFAESAAVKSATAAAEGNRGLLIVTIKDRASGQEAVAPPPPPADPAQDILPRLSIEGEVEVPARAILALFPEELVTDRAMALGDSQSLRVLLNIIHPQLKEAQVVFSVGELRGMLPPAVRKALVPPDHSGHEVESTPIALPLEVIVPQLPPEALELPPPSPPGWAEAEGIEKVVFATI